MAATPMNRSEARDYIETRLTEIEPKAEPGDELLFLQFVLRELLKGARDD